MTYTNEELRRLISCPKRISQPPKREMRPDGMMLRNEMDLVSLDEKHSFHAFIRQNVQFPENFSIGLDYLHSDFPARYCLLRCNGQHGGHKEHPHHLNCHVHRTSAIDLNAGVMVEKNIEQTAEYALFRDALSYFLRTINLQEPDVAQYFPNATQTELFGGE
jgi:hypothetical protein